MAFLIESSSKRRCARDSAEGNALHSAGCDHRGLPASGNPRDGACDRSCRASLNAATAGAGGGRCMIEFACASRGPTLGCVRVARSLRKDIRAAGDRDRCGHGAAPDYSVSPLVGAFRSTPDGAGLPVPQRRLTTPG